MTVFVALLTGSWQAIWWRSLQVPHWTEETSICIEETQVSAWYLYISISKFYV